MYIRVLAIDKEIFSGESDSVSLPSSEGQITVLEDHLPIISLLGKGRVIIRKGNKIEKEIDIKKGFAEVNPEKTTVLVE
jgi:F-type H+-transporting ATPase subunit epsilon